MPYCLIADDSTAIRKAVRGMLRDLGFEVGEAANGLEALEACRHRMPDVVLLDWNMPAMNGIEFLSAVDTKKFAKRSSIIFCTTGAEAGPIVSAMAAGASEYLVKPFDKDVLRQKFGILGFC